MVQKKDESLRTDHIDAQFPYPTKLMCKGVMFKCPDGLLDTFNIFIEQLDDKSPVDSRFLSNMN